jgi:hypothetical protein
MLLRLIVFFAALFLEGAQSLQLAAAPSLRPATIAARRAATPAAQFGGDEQPKGISRDSEPEDFFKTNMGASVNAMPIDAHHAHRCAP